MIGARCGWRDGLFGGRGELGAGDVDGFGLLVGGVLIGGGALECCIELGAGGGGIDCRGFGGGFGEDGKDVVLHLGDAAGDEERAGLAGGGVDLELAGTDADEDGGSAGADAELAVVGREDDLRDGFIEHLLLGGDDGAFEGHKARSVTSGSRRVKMKR